jgi:hypothetical protein
MLPVEAVPPRRCHRCRGREPHDHQHQQRAELENRGDVLHQRSLAEPEPVHAGEGEHCHGPGELRSGDLPPHAGQRHGEDLHAGPERGNECSEVLPEADGDGGDSPVMITRKEAHPKRKPQTRPYASLRKW